MKIKVSEILSKAFLFKDFTQGELENLISALNYEIQTFKKGDCIFTKENFEKKIGFLCTGACVVERCKKNGDSIPLNTLSKYSSFGILAVLSIEEEFPTRVVASKDCTILFIDKSNFDLLIESNPRIARNIIDFLASKVSFLNRKIRTFSSDNVEEKLASYIYSEYLAQKNLLLKFNCKKCAEAINSARASVYRALYALEAEGAIEFKNKKIKILNISLLERI